MELLPGVPGITPDDSVPRMQEVCGTSTFGRIVPMTAEGWEASVGEEAQQPKMIYHTVYLMVGGFRARRRRSAALRSGHPVRVGISPCRGDWPLGRVACECLSSETADLPERIT